MPNGTHNPDIFTAPAGTSEFSGLGGVDTLILNFRLIDATFTWVGNRVIIDTPSSHTVTTGFEVFQFTDGTVHNDDGSPLIDDLFYYAQNHDVWNAHVDAETHYDSVGWHEKRDPNAFFNTKIYLTINPDVAASGVNPLTHFHQLGWTEDRDPSLNFDVQKYLQVNPDVAAAHVDPLAHFLATGAQEGRQPFPASPLPAANGFDYVYYIQNNPDVVAAGVDPFWHFQTIGWKEGRNPNAYFDTAGYLATNPDVAAAGINPLDHFHASGWTEGRNPSPYFDIALYLQNNPDVAAAHVDPLKHFLQFGIQEGRVAYDSPLFDKNNAGNAIVEGAANGTQVGVTASWGNWVSPGLTYTISADTSGGGFRVDLHTGVITVADGNLIDFENALGHAYSVTVQAHDGANTVSHTFVIGVADAAPATNSNVPVGNVNELATNGTAVGINFDIADPNGPAATYTLTDDAGGRFTIDSSGDIRVANGAAIDYETATEHAYTITAKGTVGAQSVTQTYTIIVNDANDSAPVFTSTAAPSVAENTTAVVILTTTDVDTVGTNPPAFTITGGADHALFEITGGDQLRFIGARDFDTQAHSYDVQVTANDGANTRVQDIIVTLTDANDSAPQITSQPTFSVSETTTAVGTVTSTDADTTGEATHYTLSGANAGLFSIGDTSGVLTFNAPKDYESDARSYSIRVTASDGINSAFQDITVNLTDANDMAPVIGSATTFDVAEGTTAVGTVTSIDAELTGETTHYTLSGTDATLFSIGDTSGVLTFNAPKDYESDTRSYSIRVTASDGTNSAFQDITVNLTDANDTAPVIGSATTFDVAEGTTAVGTVTSTDADTTGETTHYILSGADAALFSIGDTSGVLTFNAPKDYESDALSYSIRVIASDGTNSSFQDITVNLTDVDDGPVNNAPVVTGSSNGTVQRDVSLQIPANAIVNGSFEQGLNNFPPDLPGWRFGGARSAFLLGDHTHSGGVALDFLTGTTVTQSVWTVAGVHYTLEFWLLNNDIQNRANDFTVSWNGTVVDTYTNVPGDFFAPYVKHTYDLVGPGGAVDLTFSGANPNGWILDDVSLTPLGTVTPGTETTSGTVTFTDVDTTDTHTVSYTPLGLNYLGTFTPTLGSDTTGGIPGTVNWTFSVADAALSSLGAQQSITQTYRVTVDDGRGGHDSRDVTVTLTNPDHAPVITGSTDGSIARDGSHVTPSGNLLGNPGFESDFAFWSLPNGGQVSGPGPFAHSGGKEFVASSGGPIILSQTIATTAGVAYLVDFWLTNDSGNGPNSVQVLWDGATVGALTNVPGTNTGFSVSYTHYTYQAVATESSTTLTFVFQNDNSHFLMDDVSVSTVPNTESTFGTIAFTDVDTIDIHTVSYQAHDPNYVGTFTPSLVPANDTTGGQNGTVNWTFSAPDSALGFLAAQQSVVQSYTVTIADNHGGTATRDVAVTLANPDHAPVITSGTQTSAVLEDYSFTVPTGNVAQNGGFEDASQDQDGRYSIIPGWTGAGFLYVPQLSSAPHSGFGTVAFATWAGNVGTWSQSVPTVAGVHYTLDFWAAAAFSTNNSIAVSWNGQTVLAHSNVPALAGHNPTGPGDYTRYSVDVVGQAGSSDLVFSLSTAYYWFLDDVSVTAVGIAPGTETAHGTITFTDGDAADTHTVSVAANGNIGTLSASLGNDSTGGNTGTVNWTYTVADSALSFLAAQQPLDQIFTVIIDDGHGGTSTQTVTIALTGVNDAPTVAHPIADQVATDAPFSFQLPANTFLDVDNGDTFALVATLADGSALPTWLHFDAATGTFSAAAAPEGAPLVVKVTATDGSNASVSDTFTIVLPEPNHAPELLGEALTKTSSQNIHALGTALLLDGHFGPGANANIAQSNTIPHVSISATAGNAIDYYKFTVTAGARGIFDIDGGLDTLINLLDSNGTLIAWNDDSLITDGAGGSVVNASPNVTYDSFLDYTFTTGGTYYLAVGGYNGGNSTPAILFSGQTYQLQVSLSNPVEHVLDSYVPGAGAPSGVTGTLVSALVDLPGNGGHDNVYDPDAAGLTGIALSATDTSNGRWWYSVDNGTTWTAIDTIVAIDEQHALLLAADAGTRLYFQPNAGFAGALHEAITFHAWDQTVGTAGTIVDASVNGGFTAISAAIETADIARLNHAPVTRSETIIANAGTNGTFVVPDWALLANDTDVDSGTTLTVGSFGQTGFTASGTSHTGGNVTLRDNSTLGGTLTYEADDGSGTGNTVTDTVTNNATSVSTLNGTSGDDIIVSAGNGDTLIGNGGNNVLLGNGGNDTLRIGTGNNIVDGGAGTDLLDLSAAAAGLTFTITQSSASTVADLTALGLGTASYANIEGVVGTALVDTINGSGGNDVIVGALGDDFLSGMDGNDTFNFAIGDGADQIDGGTGTDTLAVLGTAGIDTLTVAVTGDVITTGFGPSLTSIENVTLDLLGGIDTLSYATTAQAITVNLAAGSATGFASIAGVENLTGGDGNDSLTANSSVNVINGGAGDDTITYGIGGGADTLDGGTNTTAGDTLAFAGTSGNDALTVVVAGGAVASVAGITQSNFEKFTLDMGGNTSAGDTLSYLGTASDQAVAATVGGSATGFASNIVGVENLTGGSGSDTLTGDAGANTLTGGLGADSLSGGAGNDILAGDQSDTLLDGGTDTDTLQLSASFTAGVGQIAGIENVTLTATGTTLNLANQTDGFAITGSTGADTVTGSAGTDIITGGSGLDRMTGGGGSDTFKFTAVGDSTTSTGTADVIMDFIHGVDKIDLSQIDAKTSGSGSSGDQAFLFGGQNANTVANSVTWFESGGNTILRLDNTNNTTADMVIVLTGTNLQLNANDFLL